MLAKVLPHKLHVLSKLSFAEHFGYQCLSMYKLMHMMRKVLFWLCMLLLLRMVPASATSAIQPVAQLTSAFLMLTRSG